MLTTVRGLYQSGQIVFTEPPPAIEDTEVFITFLPVEKTPEVSNRKLGGLRGKGTLPDDFNEPLEDLKEYM